MNWIRSFMGKCGGRKFLMAIGAALGIAFHEALGINPEVIDEIVQVAAAFILGQSAADAVSKGATSTSTDVE